MYLIETLSYFHWNELTQVTQNLHSIYNRQQTLMNLKPRTFVNSQLMLQQPQLQQQINQSYTEKK